MIERSEQVGELMTALARAQGKMGNPVSDATNPHFKARYASLAAVRDAVVPVLSAEGIAVTQLVSTGDGRAECTTMLWHTSGQFLGSTLALPVVKGDAQAYGAACTYARRYGLMALVCVTGGEEEGREPGARLEDPQVRRVAVTVPHPSDSESLADQLATAATLKRIDSLLREQELSEDEREAYWLKVTQKYGAQWGASMARKLYGELQSRAESKKPRVENPETYGWVTLKAHAENPLLPGPLAAQVAMALQGKAGLNDSEVFALADEVMNAIEKGGD